MPVQQTSGAGPVRVAVAIGRQTCDRGGAIGDAVGRDRLAHAATNVAASDRGIIYCKHGYIVGFGILFDVRECYTAAMPDVDQALPEDPSQLKDMVAALSCECGTLMGELKSRDILIEKLKHQLAGMRQHRFGSRSEALDQLALTLEDEEIAASAQDPEPDDKLGIQEMNPSRVHI